MDEKEFQTVVLPAVKKELTKPLSTYTMNNLYLLLLLKKKHPKYIDSKFLKACIGSSHIFSQENLKTLCDILVSFFFNTHLNFYSNLFFVLKITPGIVSLKHPIYEEFSKELATSPNLKDFLKELDETLFKFHRNKHIISTVILKHIAEHLTEPSVLPQLLTHNYLKQTLAHFKTFKPKQNDSEFQQATHDFFNALLNVLKKPEVSGDTKYQILERLLFYPGSLIFEKTTKSKLVQQITLLLDVEGVKKLAAVYRDVVSGKKRQHESTEMWWNNDRLYAAQLLVKLLGHQAVVGENEWRIEQLQFLMELSLIKGEDGPSVGVELAGKQISF